MKWYGVLCNIRGNIIGIHLPDNRLIGSFSTSIGSLIYLKTVAIYNTNDCPENNKSVLQQYDPMIFSLPSLKELTLRNLKISLNVNLDNFVNDNILEYFDISYNYLNGTLPFVFDRFRFIEHLDLSNNNLTSSLDPLTSLPNTVEKLFLHNNLFSSEIPLLTRLFSSLEVLDLRNNSLTGNIPVL